MVRQRQGQPTRAGVQHAASDGRADLRAEPVQHVAARAARLRRQAAPPPAPAGSRRATGGAVVPPSILDPAGQGTDISDLVKGPHRAISPLRRGLDQPQLRQPGIRRQVVPVDGGRSCRLSNKRLRGVGWLARQPGEQPAPDGRGTAAASASSGARVPGRSAAFARIPSSSASESDSSRRAAHSSTRSATAGGGAEPRSPPAAAAASPPRPPGQPYWHRRLAAGQSGDRPFGQQSSRRAGPARGGQPSRQAEQLEEPLVGERPSGWLERDAECHVGELRQAVRPPRSPATRRPCPSRPGSRGRPSSPAATVTGASQSSKFPRYRCAPNAAARCHSPAAAITPVPASMPASGWALVFRRVPGPRSGRTAESWRPCRVGGTCRGGFRSGGTARNAGRWL